jgi:hypothetical protein
MYHAGSLQKGSCVMLRVRSIPLALVVCAAVLAAVAHTAASGAEPKTVTGNVVDAACFMIHPQAADASSHKECGTACMSRGVPLAIAGDDGALYFPADGNKRLSALHGQKVKASGTVTEKKEPMELKMPVGDKNTMTVKVEGGYKVIAIDSVVKVPTPR